MKDLKKVNSLYSDIQLTHLNGSAIQNRPTDFFSSFKNLADDIVNKFDPDLNALIAEMKDNVTSSGIILTGVDLYNLNQLFGASISSFSASGLTLGGYYQKLNEMKITDAKFDEQLSLDDNFRRWFYVDRAFNFSFAPVPVGAVEQTITYCKTPEPFKAILYYEGVPFLRAKVTVTQVYRGVSKQMIITTNDFGIAEYTPDAVDVEDDKYGPGKMEIIFEKYNQPSRSTFTVNLKPRLRLHIEYLTGDNQEAEIGTFLPKPLLVYVLDEEDHAVPGIQLFWKDLTPGITSSGFANEYTTTIGDKNSPKSTDGNSSNTWKMNTTEGSHLAKVEFVHVSTQDYVMEDGAKVLFLANAKPDLLTVLRSKTWNLINGPIKHTTTVNNPNCNSILTMPAYELRTATLNFQLVNGITKVVETRGGICQAHCDMVLYFTNPCTVKINEKAESYSNTMDVLGVNNDMLQLSNFSPNIPGGGLPWILMGSKIVSYDSKRLLLTSTYGYYTGQLIFE